MIGHLVKRAIDSIPKEWEPSNDARLYKSMNDIVRDKCEICFISRVADDQSHYHESRRLYLYRVFLLRFVGKKYDKDTLRSRFVVCCGLCMSLLYNEQCKTFLRENDNDEEFYNVVRRTYWNYHFNPKSTSKIRRNLTRNK